MKKNNLTEQDVLSIERVSVPDSTQLQNNILRLTEELPQYIEQTGASKIYNLSNIVDKTGIKKGFFAMFEPYAGAVAAGLLVVILSSTFSLPDHLLSGNDQAVLIDDYTLMSPELMSPEQLENEIEWQEMMLLNDEIAFLEL